MSITDTPAPQSQTDDTLLSAGIVYLALALGWLPAFLLGDAIGRSATSSLFVSVLAYAVILVAAKQFTRRLT